MNKLGYRFWKSLQSFHQKENVFRQIFLKLVFNKQLLFEWILPVVLKPNYLILPGITVFAALLCPLPVLFVSNLFFNFRLIKLEDKKSQKINICYYYCQINRFFFFCRNITYWLLRQQKINLNKISKECRIKT